MDYALRSDTAIFALGGLGEVGKNMYCIEYEDSLIIIDSGAKFPESDLPGIDYVIPDYSYLVRNQFKVKALFIPMVIRPYWWNSFLITENTCS